MPFFVHREDRKAWLGSIQVTLKGRLLAEQRNHLEYLCCQGSVREALNFCVLGSLQQHISLFHYIKKQYFDGYAS